MDALARRAAAGTLRLGGLAGLLLASAAGTCPDTKDWGCDLCTTAAVVYGLVTDTAGQPLPYAGVDVGVFRDSCAGSTLVLTGLARCSTGSTGRYRIQMETPYAPFAACLRISLTRPGSLGEADTVVAGARVAFLPTERSSRDSVAVNVTLRPARGVVP